jgi:hypothetical protein
MKTKLSLFLLILALSPVPHVLSQIPQGFNYQAIARDGSGNILPNTPLQAMMYVQSLSTGGTLFWKELHSTITTNSFGLFTLVVGNGTRQTESTVATFDLIDWSVTPKYLKTEIYYSGSWKDMGTSQLMSVPYSMTAGDLAGTVDKLAVKGTTSGLEDALFEVKNKDGQTVFAVYNEGVRVYVSDGAKAVKGGFAVGGFGTDKAESTKYLFVGKDSVRIYLDTNPLTKGKKSGFAVGGYDLTKGSVQNYLDVSADSVRIYIDSDPSTKKLKGGFAVGGYDMTKGDVSKYLRVTPDSTRILTADTLKGFGVSNILSGKAENYLKLTPSNYFIGHEAGKKVTLAKYNSVMGFQAGSSLTTGEANEFIGYQAGMKNATGSYNIFLGYQAGYNSPNARFNTSLGYQAGYNAISIDGSLEGSANVLIGYQAGYNVLTGYRNVMIGPAAGFAHQVAEGCVFIGFGAGSGDMYPPVASENNFIGYYAGKNLSLGDDNVFIGGHAGGSCYNAASSVIIGGMANSANWALDPSNNNVYIGYSAARVNPGNNNVIIGRDAGNNSVGSNNLFIGYQAGYYETESNKLFIDNQTRTSETDGRSKALIYGIFDASPSNQILTINGNVGIKIAPTHLIHLSGGAYSDGSTWTNSSDRNLKENFEPVDGAMIINLIDQLPVTRWNYKTDNPAIKHIGPVAQDFYSLFSLGNNDTSISTVDPSGLALVAIKELSKQNKALKEQIESYKSQLQSLQEKVDKIESLLAKTLGE